MKISLLTSDLSYNSLGRTYRLALMLSQYYEVEIIGPKFNKKKGVWSPFLEYDFPIKAVDSYYFPFFIKNIPDIIKQIDSDFLYAVKPKFSSYGVSLIGKQLMKRESNLFLDIDDYELAFFLQGTNKFKDLISSIGHPDGFFYNLLMESVINKADEITVSSNFLKERYGGNLIPHGCDTEFLNPKNYLCAEDLKKELKLNSEKIILFLGTPGPHKGIEDILNSIKKIKSMKIILLLVGDTQNDFCKGLEKTYRNFIKLVGIQPYTRVPLFYMISDLVVISQRKSLISSAQVPAKVFDAMSMAKPIIATDISDLPDILNGCGYIVKSDNISDLSAKIESCLINENESLQMGKLARDKCVKYYDYKVLGNKIKRLIDNHD